MKRAVRVLDGDVIDVKGSAGSWDHHDWYEGASFEVIDALHHPLGILISSRSDPAIYRDLEI